MQNNEDDFDGSLSNDTDAPVYFDTRPTYGSPQSPPYFIPRRPRVIKMRDLSPETKNRLTSEYYDGYDPWTGVRIAATLGILISLFTLFLIYKSRYNKSKTPILEPKKTNIYLYEEDDLGECDIGSIVSSEHASSYGYPYPFSKRNVEDRMMFPFQEGFQLEEVYVKNEVVECVALKVHRSGKRASKSGSKLETARVSEDASRSLPCSPYKIQQQQQEEQQQEQQEDTDVKVPPSPTYSTDPTSLTGSITSFGSTDTGVSVNKRTKILGKASKGSESKTKKTRKSSTGEKDSKTCPKSLVVTTKNPQDYRRRSTIVAIARRKRPS